MRLLVRPRHQRQKPRGRFILLQMLHRERTITIIITIITISKVDRPMPWLRRREPTRLRVRAKPIACELRPLLRANP